MTETTHYSVEMHPSRTKRIYEDLSLSLQLIAPLLKVPFRRSIDLDTVGTSVDIKGIDTCPKVKISGSGRSSQIGQMRVLFSLLRRTLIEGIKMHIKHKC
jgi:hypothetical protein